MNSRAQSSVLNDAAMPASTASTRVPVAQKPNATAMVTTLLWNAAVAVGLVAWLLIASLISPTPSDAGEDWSGLFLFIAIVMIGTAIVIGTLMGAATTAIIVRRRLRRASAQRQLGITTRTAILLGSAGTGIGWLLGVGATAFLVFVLSTLSTLTA